MLLAGRRPAFVLRGGYITKDTYVKA